MHRRDGKRTRRIARIAAVLALLGALTASSLDAAAQGRIVLKRPVMVTLVPPGPLVGDGTAQILCVLVTDDRGELAPAANFRGTEVDAGRLGAWTQLGPGVWTAEYYAPAVGVAAQATLALKVKVGRETAQRSFPLQVVPAPGVQLTMQANPAQILLGTHPQAELTVTATGPDGQPVDGLSLAVGASLGSVEPAEGLGNGAYRVVYRPPAGQSSPALAVLTVVDKGSPETTFGLFPVPLVGMVNWRLETGVAGIQAGMEVGGQRFGPLPTDAAGVAMVPILVPPGVRTATAFGVDAAGTELAPTTVDLQVPSFTRLAMLPPAEELPGDGGTAFPLYLFVVGEDAQPAASAPLQIEASAGDFTAVDALGNGLFRAIYVPPAVTANQLVTIKALLVGSESMDQAAVQFRVVPPLPRQLALTARPAAVPGGTQTVTLSGALEGATDEETPGTGVSFVGPAGVIDGALPMGGGVFEASYTGAFDRPVALSAEALVPASGRPVDAVVAWPVMDQVPINDRVTIVAMALDRYGMPVRGVPLSASSLNDVGTVQGGGTTDGFGRVVFTFGATPLTGPAVVIVADDQGHSIAVPLWQADPVLIGLQLPLSGGSRQLGMMRRWGALRGRLMLGAGVPTVGLPTAGGPAPAGAATPAGGTAGAGATASGAPAGGTTGAGTTAGAGGTAASGGAPAEPSTPWGTSAASAAAAPAPGGTAGPDPLAAAWAEEIRARLATGETETRALRGVEVVPADGERYDIVVRYSHAATVIVVAGQQVKLTREAWFAGWATLVGDYTRTSGFKSRDFRLIDDDTGKALVLSTTQCRTLSGIAQVQREAWVAANARVE